MKKLLLIIICALFPTLFASAQGVVENACPETGNYSEGAENETPKSVFSGEFECKETGFRLHLNLDAEDILIPGMSFLGPTNGYLDGVTNNHVYGVWMLLKFDFSNDGKKVRLRFSNDIGSDSQDVDLTLLDDDSIKYEAIGTNTIRKVEGGKKLVKTPSVMVLKRKK